METIKQLDARCRELNHVVYKKKIKQFNLYGHQWLRGPNDDYAVKGYVAK